MNFKEYVLTEGKKTKFKKPSWKELKKRIKKVKKIKFKKPSKPKTAFNITSRVKKGAKKLFTSILKKMKLTEGKQSELFGDRERREERYTGKVGALATFLDIQPSEVDENSWGGYDADGAEWSVLADSEADESAKEYIEQSVWAFNTNFLMGHIDVSDANDYYNFETSYYDEDEREEVEIGDDDEVFYMGTGMSLEDFVKELQEKYEDGNDELINLIGDFDGFVDDAISSDGRGHFMSSYDGEENEEGDYYIYRTN